MCVGGGGGVGGHRPCWQLPWHPGPVRVTLTVSDTSDTSLPCFNLSEGKGGQKAHRSRFPCHLLGLTSRKQMACDLYSQAEPKRGGGRILSIYLTLPDTIAILMSHNISKNNTIIFPISVADNKSYVWSMWWSSSSRENYSPGLSSSGAKWCSHLVDSGSESRYKRTATEKTTPASMAYHKPWEPCKSQFTVQTPSNNCREKQVRSFRRVWGKWQWLRKRQICKYESALSWWALSNVIAAEYEMKFHFRWHQIEKSAEKKVASSTLPLTISSMESNQGGVWLKFLVLFLPHFPSVSPPPPILSWQVLRLLQLLQSWVFICMWLSSTDVC